MPPVIDSADATNEAENDRPEVAQVHFIILKPLYAPESSSVLLEVPATLCELEEAIKLERETAAQACFPHLCNVLPQPLLGRALFIALPRWHPMHNIVCFNTQDIDGRLFATPAPAYADKEELACLAQIPDAIECVLYVGLDDLPLQPGVSVHLFPGAQLRFTRLDTALSEPAFLPELLLSASFWVAIAAPRRPLLRHAYCLVTEEGQRLHVDDFSHPFRFRQHIAACLGLTVGSFRTFPACPALTDVELDGVACNTAIAVSRASQQAAEPSITIMLDCRPILGGLRSLPVPEGPLDTRSLSQVLQAEAPLGQSVQVRIDHTPHDAPVRPGQVVVIEYVENPAASQLAASSSAASAEVGTGDAAQEPPDTGGTYGGLAPDPSSASSADGFSDENPGGPNPGDEQANFEGSGPSSGFVAVILCPDYKPEMCSPRISVPVPLLSAMFFRSQTGSVHISLQGLYSQPRLYLSHLICDQSMAVFSPLMSPTG